MIDATIIAVAGALYMASPQSVSLREAECIAEAVYFESRGEPVDAQVAVASTVVNRGRPCEVVRQRGQFSYRKLKKRRIDDKSAWRQAAEVAVLVQAGAISKYPSTHFHDTSVVPKWTSGMEYVGRSGGMRFWNEGKAIRKRDQDRLHKRGR